MKSRHAAAVSLILSLAVGAGAYAAQRTTAAASNSTKSTAQAVPGSAKRAAALDRTEVTLREALRRRPPALPAVPRYKPVRWKPASSLVAATPAARVATATAPARAAAKPAPSARRAAKAVRHAA
ncbi:MAG: hypothetical protein QOD65_2388, partial [Gaiellales bacterium]|nr:hypothetical protein [Gaiellales bacterium]